VPRTTRPDTGPTRSAGGAEDLLTGNVDGAGHQFGDAAGDAGAAVKDTAKAVIDPFTGW
jgi:hypothetical protein